MTTEPTQLDLLDEAPKLTAEHLAGVTFHDLLDLARRPDLADEERALVADALVARF